MNAIDQRDVFMADLGDVGPHPVVVATRQEAIPVLSSVIVVLVTSTVRGHRAEVPLDEHHGLDHPSVANCDALFTVSKRSLTRRLGRLDDEQLTRLKVAVRFALDL